MLPFRSLQKYVSGTHLKELDRARCRALQRDDIAPWGAFNRLDGWAVWQGYRPYRSSRCVCEHGIGAQLLPLHDEYQAVDVVKALEGVGWGGQVNRLLL